MTLLAQYTAPGSGRRALLSSNLVTPNTCWYVRAGEPHLLTSSPARRGGTPTEGLAETLRSNACFRSRMSSLSLKSLRPGSRSMRKSTSLPGWASPRATDPNTRTLCAPRMATIRRISSRRLRSCSIVGRSISEAIASGLHLLRAIMVPSVRTQPWPVRAPAHQVGGERRRAALGTTLAGRLLFVVFVRRDTVIRVVTARDASVRERHRYRRRGHYT